MSPHFWDFCNLKIQILNRELTLFLDHGNEGNYYYASNKVPATWILSSQWSKGTSQYNYLLFFKQLFYFSDQKSSFEAYSICESEIML